MRDALSLLDQAIASSDGRLTTESVRQLAGTAPSDALEHVMEAVERSASDELLRLIDKLITEGHSPTHFARQLVRFLRNAVVAKVAGPESSLLQISAGERERVGRVAATFSEEDLARFLQIMLRTHGELGYRQEQRLHLELGLLKMAHARRLLPIEQLLKVSEVANPDELKELRPILMRRLGNLGRSHDPEQAAELAVRISAGSVPGNVHRYATHPHREADRAHFE